MQPEDKGSIFFFPWHDIRCDIVCAARIKNRGGSISSSALHRNFWLSESNSANPPNVPVARYTNASSAFFILFWQALLPL